MKKQEISVTVDSVIFRTAKNGSEKEVLLVQRKNGPYKRFWALPGGFLEEEESLETGAKRELEEETGLEIDELKLVGIFDKPDRDPRGRTLSVAFKGISEDTFEVKGNDDAEEARWFDINSLPDLAFDHQEIFKQAMKI